MDAGIRIVGMTSQVLKKTFFKEAATLQGRLERAMRKNGQLLQTRVKAKASGRPGPRPITGDYRRSIGLNIESSAWSVTAEVGTNADQGRRLEFGFVGIDSLGRKYYQTPFPHFLPALTETYPKIERNLEKVAEGGEA